ncbi:hypothetical protein GUITHDRAFT_121277, partial [Guillardia theta CCMP2712]
MSNIKFSFSMRGIAPGVSEEELQSFFSQFGSVVSVKQVPLKPGMTTGAAYVNFSSGEASDILALNNTSPPFNQGMSISIRQQANFLARAVAAVKEIQFSVSVRGVHWTVGQEPLSREFSQHAKIHSIKMADALMHHRLATRAAYINFAEGTRKLEQDASVARAAAAKPITAKMQMMAPPAPEILLSKKRKEELTATSLSDEEEEEEGNSVSAPSSSTPSRVLTTEEQKFLQMQAESAEETQKKEVKVLSLQTKGAEKKNHVEREEKKKQRSIEEEKPVVVPPEALRGGLLSSSMRRALQQQQQQQQQQDGPPKFAGGLISGSKRK